MLIGRGWSALSQLQHCTETLGWPLLPFLGGPILNRQAKTQRLLASSFHICT